jgi:hypothetical protein
MILLKISVDRFGFCYLSYAPSRETNKYVEQTINQTVGLIKPIQIRLGLIESGHQQFFLIHQSFLS